MNSDFNNQYIRASDFNSGNKLGEIKVQYPVEINNFEVFWPYVICLRYNQEEHVFKGIRIFNMEKENILKDILWKVPMNPLGFEIKNKFLVILKNVTARDVTNEIIFIKRFINYEDLFDEKISSFEDLSSRQFEECDFIHKNIIAGNSVLTIFNGSILKRSYWISKNQTEIYKSKNVKSDADEEMERKKRKIN